MSSPSSPREPSGGRTDPDATGAVAARPAKDATADRVGDSSAADRSAGASGDRSAGAAADRSAGVTTDRADASTSRAGASTDRSGGRAEDDRAAARPAVATGAPHGADEPSHDRESVLAREKDRFGGIKWGSAFFGWLTATGTAVLLTAVLLAAGATVGVATGADATAARDEAGAIGLAGGIALLAVLLIAYFCGGYVAGRMARFSGVKQGIAVWVWAVVIAAAVAIAGLVLGDQYDLLDRIGGFPRLPIGGGDVTTGSIVAVAIALVAALIGAILGGLAGMRFHRKVDKAGLGH